jgi:PAP2 superfamily C-terminal
MSAYLPYLLRAGAIAGALVLWFWTQKLISRKAPPVSASGLGDRVHDWTAPWLDRLHANPRAANGLLIATSAIIDLIGLALLAASILGDTLRPFLALLILFGCRQVCQLLITLPPPPRIIWRDPGFPSLLVTYGVSNDFFFSGHTAIAFLGAIEVAHIGHPWLTAAGYVVATGQAFAVLVLRAHYTMDVIAAVFAAFACSALATRLAPMVDVLL